jgi:biopolymer transport protein ExbD
MSLLIVRMRRRVPLMVQLTAMIDIFAMIVIFLVKGTVIGVTEVTVPDGLHLPTSISKENVEAAPRVLISNGEVFESIFSQTYAVGLFHPTPTGAEDPRVAELRGKARGYLASLTPAARSTLLLNVIADRATPYRQIFDVIRLFREAGFETLLFVAAGPEGAQESK